MMARQRTGCARPSANSASKTRERKSAQWLIKSTPTKKGDREEGAGDTREGCLPAPRHVHNFLLRLIVLAGRASKRGHLAGLSDGCFVHTASVEPLGGELDTGEQVNFWLEAEFAAGFLHAVLVVAAKHHRAKLGDDGFGARQGSYDSFRNDAAVEDGKIRQVQRRALAANRVSDGVEHLKLGQRAVVGDIVDVARSLWMIGGQHEALHHIGDV